MKILIISQYFWPESFRINDLAAGLSGKGHEVSVLTGLPNYPSGKFFKGYGILSCGSHDYQGITIYRVPLLVRGKGKSWQLALNYLSFTFFSCLFGPFLCRGQYDLIFVYEPSPFTVGITGTLFRRLKNAPMLFWVQDLWPESLTATKAVKSPFLLSLISKMVRFIYKRCDRVLVQSRAFMQPVAQSGASPDRILYFPNWAEDHYQPVMLNENTPEKKYITDGFCIMFAGNLGMAQSLETLILAADKLKHIDDIHWVILGEGRQGHWIRAKIADYKLGNKIHMLGHHPPEEMPFYFSSADALLITLRRDPIFTLTVPSKLQSYLACGKPILGSLDGEGAKIINESGAGYATAAGNADSLAEAAVKLYQLPDEERKQMGIRGRDYYDKHFSRKQLIDQLEKLMEKVCGS